MRKVLFAILAAILLIVTVIVIYKGISIGNFEIWGIKQIVEENEAIDLANKELENKVKNEFQSAISKLNNSGEVMQEAKKEYEETALTISNSEYYMQTEKYKLEFLWTRIGNYAKKHKVTPKMEVASGSTTGVYNLIITVVGKYSNIADFISAIENDSRLGFKIEDFSMEQYTSEEGSNLVQGKFTCKEIKIDIKSIDSDNTNQDERNSDESTNSNQTNTNTTNSNTANTNSTSTNSVNTNNTNQNTTNSNTTKSTDTDDADIIT